MIPAHLVFADINGHSAMPIERRAPVLRQFWATCTAHKPLATDRSSVSFYDVDNDSLMAGFSGVEGMDSASEVLFWALRLHHALSANDVPVSLGVAVAAGRYAIDWETLPGFLPELRTHLYYSDDLDWPHGRVDRRRLMGDPLIVAARLLTLAKRVTAAVAFAFVPEGAIHEPIEDIQDALSRAGLAPAFSLAGDLCRLPDRQSRWLEDWGLDPYGLGAGGLVTCSDDAFWHIRDPRADLEHRIEAARQKAIQLGLATAQDVDRVIRGLPVAEFRLHFAEFRVSRAFFKPPTEL